MCRLLYRLGLHLSLFVTATLAPAQVSTAWTARYNGFDSGYDTALAMKVDSAGNVYVAGESVEEMGFGLDLVTIKYSPSGTRLWTSRYGLPGSTDSARDVTVDATGNVYVIGHLNTTNGADAVTVKYNHSGVEQWVKTFDGGTNDFATAVSVDSTGNIYVISAQALLKYDPNGTLLWPKRLPFTPSALTVDNSGATYISGATYGGNNRWTIETVKHDTGGNQSWTATYSGASPYAEAIAVDSAGNVYVGSSAADTDGADFLVLKYNSAGTLLWNATYDGPSPFADNLRDLTIDTSGNVYAVGTSTGAGDHDIIAVKFNATGVRQWASRYNSFASASDVAVGIRVGSTGDVYVGGYSLGSGSQYDYVAVKLDANGNQQWAARHDNAGGPDFAYDFDIGPSETVFLTGSSQFLDTGTDAFTLKLPQSDVPGRPQITMPPTDQEVTVSPSANIIFSVTVTGPGLLSYQWRLNGGDIPRAVFPTHEILGVQPHHAGDYSVRVSNAAGETVTPEARLTVHQPPFIYDQSTNQTTVEGRSVTLSVNANGDPVLRYQWRFNNVDLPGETNQLLRLLTVSTNAAGTYTATVTNAYGNAVSIPIRLTVLPRGPLDRWTWRSPLPQGNGLLDIAYGNGRYVGVGQEGTIVVSTNGLDWTIHSRDIGDILGIVFAEGMFIAVARTGIYTSIDGVSWTFRRTPPRQDTPGQPHDLFAVAYGAGRFVAVGTGLLSSDDGTSWSDHSAAFQNFYASSVAYGNGRFIIPYGASAVVSSNGIDWILSFVPSGTPVQIAYGNGLFIGHSYDRLYASTNGLDWQLVLGPTNNFYFGGVDFANGQYLGLGNVLFASLDGISWTRHLYSPDFSLVVTAAASGPGETIVVGDDGLILRSTDGTSWTQIGGGSPNNLRGIVHARNRFTVIGNDGVIWYSAEGRNFLKTIAPNTNNLRAIAYGNDAYVIAGSGGALLSSRDGSTWQTHDVTTNDLYGLVFVNGHFLAVGNFGTIVLSTNGRDWSVKSAGISRRFQGIAYGDGLYVTTGQRGAIARSYDAINWTPVSFPNSDMGYLESLIYTNGLFVGAGSNGRIFTSGDGTNWVRRLTGDFQELETIIYAEGQFIAAGARGTVVSSSNVVDWVVHHALTGNAFRQLVYARGALWGVGNNEMVLQSGQFKPYLSLGSISPVGTEVIVRAEPGQTIKAQRSTNLQNWIDLPAQTMSDDTLRFVDPGTDQLRFYRTTP